MDPLAKRLEEIKAQARLAPGANVPILGQKPQMCPMVHLIVNPIEERVPPAELMLALMTPDGKFNKALTDAAAPPDVLDSKAWFEGSESAQKATGRFWLIRAMGCLYAALNTMDPTFNLRTLAFVKEVEAATPISKPATPEAQKAYEDMLEEAKRQFEAENPHFDAKVGDYDLEGLRAKAKKGIEMAQGDKCFEGVGGGYEPPGGFVPRDPRVLHPYIEITSPEANAN
jgi:hypothetical protein